MSDAWTVRRVPGRQDARLQVFRCGAIVDTFAVLTDRFLVLVDTMVNRESMEAVMDMLAGQWGTGQDSRTLLAVNTHGDWDHVWGNGLFAGPSARYPAPILGHRSTAEIMSSPDAAALLASFRKESPGRFDSAEWQPPTICFDGELRIDGGDLTLDLIPTPGHTPDHLSVWIPQIRSLLAGDAAEMPFPSVSDPAALPALRSSLRRLRELEAEVALYCHAPGVSDPALIDHNIAYFDELEERCRAALARGVPPTPDDRADRAALIGWPLEEALPPGTSIEDLTDPDFYREGHEAAVRAMVTYLCTAG